MVFLWFLVGSFWLFGQNVDPVKLNKEISDLNNQFKYDSSILKLEDIISRKSSSSLDKYYAYLQKAVTYKRLFNYPEVHENLNYALREGQKTKEKKAVEARILTEKMFIEFDLIKYDEARVLYNQINPDDFHLLDGTTKAFYLNVASKFSAIDGDLEEAKNKLYEGIEILKKENPQHLAGVYCKFINLAEINQEEEMAVSAFKTGMHYADKYNMDIYKMRLLYDFSNFYLTIGDYKNAYIYLQQANDKFGKYNAPFENGKLNLLEKELINKRRDLELRNEQNLKLFLIVLSTILLALIVVLFLLFKSNKQKRVLTERENDRMRHDLEIISQELNDKNESKLDVGKYEFTSRQLEIIELVKQGKTNKEIGTELFISENTVKYHLKIIYNLVGIDNRLDLK